MKISRYVASGGLLALTAVIMLGLSVNTAYAFQKSLYPKEVRLADVKKSADYHKKFNVVKIINTNWGKARRPYLYVVYVFLAGDADVKTTGPYEEKIPLGQMSIKEVIDDYNSGIKAYNYNPGATLNTFEPDNQAVSYVLQGNRVEDIDVWQSGKAITLDIEYGRSLSGDDVEA